MDSRETLKQKLADCNSPFAEVELQEIIDREFFDDSIEADMDLIDLAARRLALVKGISDEQAFETTAQVALKKFLDSRK